MEDRKATVREETACRNWLVGLDSLHEHSVAIRKLRRAAFALVDAGLITDEASAAILQKLEA
jgi:hypothetical protein